MIDKKIVPRGILAHDPETANFLLGITPPAIEGATLYRAAEIAARPDDVVFLLPTENDADCLAAMECAASCHRNITAPCAALAGRVVVVIADPGPDAADAARAAHVGLTPAIEAAGSWRGFPVDVQTRRPPNGQTFAGWLEGIGGASVAEARRQFEEWAMPDDKTESLAEVWDAMPPRSPEVIEGILRRGHKMIVSGPSKAGKSFALLELAAALAEGAKWFGTFQCRQSSVLYLNLEIDRPSALHRMKAVYTALTLPPANIANIRFLHLRGTTPGIDALVRTVAAIARLRRIEVIIIDPVYKIGVEDENSTKDIKALCLRLDEIAVATGAAVVFCHHFSKGQQDGKSAIDRQSGSGVLARDPDAILSLSELQGGVGFRLEYSLREFAPPPPLSLRFVHPVHVAAPELAETPLQGARNVGRAAADADAAKTKREAEAAAEKTRLQACILGMASRNRDTGQQMSKTEFAAAVAAKIGVAMSRAAAEIQAMIADRRVAEMSLGEKNRKMIVIPEKSES